MQSLEIAVYEAKDPEGFVERQGRLHEQVGTVFDGYVTSLGLRSTVEDGVFADLVLWADETAAVAAAEALPMTEELAWLLGPALSERTGVSADSWERVLVLAYARATGKDR